MLFLSRFLEFWFFSLFGDGVRDTFFWIKVHDRNWRPASRIATPAFWTLSLGRLIDLSAFAQQGAVQASVTLCRRNEFDGAMAVFLVVPTHERADPLPCRHEAFK